MSTTAQKLTQLLNQGMTVYPGGMRGLRALPPPTIPRGVNFTPTQQGWVWGGLGAVPIVSTPKQIEASKKALKWVQKAFPELYDAAVRRLGNVTGAGGVSGLGAEGGAAAPTGVGWYDKIMNAITTIAPEYLKAKAQKDLLQVQLDRARQGLPPLDVSQYAPGVQVSLPPGYISSQFSEIPQWVYWAGAGVVGLLVLPRLLPAARRR